MIRSNRKTVESKRIAPAAFGYTEIAHIRIDLFAEVLYNISYFRKYSQTYFVQEGY